MALIGGVRFAYRVSRTYRDTGFLTFNPQVTSARRVLIVGAGEAGAMVVKELKAHGYQHDTSHHGGQDNPIKAMLGGHAIYYNNKRSRWTCYLDTASAKK